jgi:thiosulfate dehydrogenase (quinone) large subunit
METEYMGLIVESPQEIPPAPHPHGSPSDEVISPRTDTSGSAEGHEPTAIGGPTHNLRLSDWLYRSNEASILWLVVRLWLGYEWLNAGYQKIWGSEHTAFWFGGGAGVKGFATAGVAGSTAGKGAGASYGWWAAFLHNFVIPNASWIAKLVALSELLIGVALILGLLTGLAAAGALLLNLTYMFTGSAGVNAMFAILAVLLILAWRNAGWFGLDRFTLRHEGRPGRLGSAVGRLTHRPVVVAPTASAGAP